jgi:hypothetical protein
LGGCTVGVYGRARVGLNPHMLGVHRAHILRHIFRTGRGKSREINGENWQYTYSAASAVEFIANQHCLSHGKPSRAMTAGSKAHLPQQ